MIIAELTNVTECKDFVVTFNENYNRGNDLVYYIEFNSQMCG